MTRLIVAVIALVLTGCRAAENITANKEGFWESPCHPGIYLTDTPPAAAPECQWTFVEHRRP